MRGGKLAYPDAATNMIHEWELAILKKSKDEANWVKKAYVSAQQKRVVTHCCVTLLDIKGMFFPIILVMQLRTKFC